MCRGFCHCVRNCDTVTFCSRRRMHHTGALETAVLAQCELIRAACVGPQMRVEQTQCRCGCRGLDSTALDPQPTSRHVGALRRSIPCDDEEERSPVDGPDRPPFGPGESRLRIASTACIEPNH